MFAKYGCSKYEEKNLKRYDRRERAVNTLQQLFAHLKARSHSDLRLNHGKNRQKVVSREADNVVRLDVEFKTS